MKFYICALCSWDFGVFLRAGARQVGLLVSEELVNAVAVAAGGCSFSAFTNVSCVFCTIWSRVGTWGACAGVSVHSITAAAQLASVTSTDIHVGPRCGFDN